MTKVLAALVTIALCAVPAHAKDTPRSLAREARDLVRNESFADGIRLYADALRLAEKGKDLPAQEHVVRGLQHEAASRMMRASEREDLQRTAFLVLLDALDPKRNNVFLSRGHVAHALLLEATHSGGFRHVEAAAAAAKVHAKLKGSGAYAQAMASYGDGLLLVAADEPGEACPLLQDVLDKAVAESWTVLALYAGTELAAAHVKAKANAKAASALRKAATLLKVGGDRAIVGTWRGLVKSRLDGAAADVLAPFKEAVKPHGGGDASRSTGNSSGKPPSGGSRDRSKVGEAWKKLSKRKPFVTVQRTADGYAIRQSFDKKFAALQPFAHGVKHHGDGGITLSFWNRGVRLHMIDMTGRESPPGESSTPRGFLLFHTLARGETWGVNKAGGVVITAK